MTEYLPRNCAKCNYEWTPRREAPKACPRCKTRLDYSGVSVDGRKAKYIN